MATTELDHFAGEPWQLEPIAAQQVIAHRGSCAGIDRNVANVLLALWRDFAG
jgi:hypothetical protein